MTPSARRWLAAAAVLAGAAGVFWLPYFFPPSLPTRSESYTLGFDNRVAVLALVLALGLLGWLRPRSGGASVFFEAKRAEPGRVPLLLCLALAVLYALIDWAANGGLPLQQYGESAYTLPRVEYFVDLGLHPYRDFEFAYGPLLLFFPALCVKALHGLVPPPAVYTGCHIVLNTAGLFLFARTLDALPLRRNLRIGAFLLMALAWSNPTLGMQYTVLRWILPFALLVWVYRRVPESASAPPDVKSLALRTAGAIFAMLLVSPEYSVVMSVAFAVLFASLALARGRAYAVPMLGWPVSVGLFAALAGPEYFQSILGFSSGGMLFPVFPTPAILVYFTALIVAVPPIIERVRREGPGAAGSLETGWTLFAVGLIPGALGRCDSGHVLMYGWPIMLAAADVLLRGSSSLARAWIGAWALAFLVAGQISLYVMYEPIMRPIWDASLREASATPYPPPFANVLDRYDRLQTPFIVDTATERYLREHGKFVPEYYRDLVDVMNEKDLRRKIGDLRPDCPVLVPSSTMQIPYELYVKKYTPDWSAYKEENRRFYRWLLMFPLSYEMKKEPFLPTNLVAAHIFKHYDFAEQAGAYLILTPKNHSSSSPASSSSPSTPVEPPR
ncbi:MAG: hypothetical protein KIS92_13865 [Planctomycetota bacterium]|nr:hypothetical protein [Planctomycetota bacterium]